MQQKNLLLFLGLALLLFVGYANLKQLLWPPPPRKPDLTKKAEDATKPEDQKAEGNKSEDKKAPEKEEPRAPAVVQAPKAPPVTETGKLITLGSRERNSRFHLQVVFDPRGAGVRSVLLNK